MLRIKEYNDFLANHNHFLEEQVRARTGQLTNSYRDTIFTLARAAEYHDEDSGLHGKRGEKTPLSARIMMLGDVYDALRAKRPYISRTTRTNGRWRSSPWAMRTLPAHFDPTVLAAFGACVDTFREIYASHVD